MKRLISMVTMVTAVASINANAALKCKPLQNEMDAQSEVVSNFAHELQKLESKVLRLEDKISDKQDQISSIQSDIQNQKQKKQNKEDQKITLISSIEGIEIEIGQIESDNASLVSRMHQLDVEIQNLPARSNARRMALREKKRAEKKVERNMYDISALQDQVAPVVETINSLESSIVRISRKIQKLKQDKSDVRNAVPTLNSLKNKKAQAEITLMQQDSIQQENLAILDEASEKVLACKTYKVKYSLALDIAKEIYQVGCDNFSPRNLNGMYKNQAQDEVISEICGSN